MLRWFLLIVLSIFFLTGCASSDNKSEKKQKKSYPNLVQLQQPGDAPPEQGKVYIDSVAQVTTAGGPGLLISGDFADGCTHLQSVTHRVQNDSLSLELSAWRSADDMCTQALVPFTYIYEGMSKQQMTGFSQITIQDNTYSF